VSVPIGITTTLAVALHEIPQEIGDFGTLVFGGLSVPRALMLNFISALGSILGVLLVMALGTRVTGLADQILPLTAGGFIYIAGADLIPELRKDAGLGSSLLQFGAILLGLAIMYSMVNLLGEPSHELIHSH